MKHFINVSSFRSQNKEMLKKALYNLFNLKKLSVVAEGMKTSMRRDCDQYTGLIMLTSLLKKE